MKLKLSPYLQISDRTFTRSLIFVAHKFLNLRYFFEIAYKGTYYHGWQIQANARSIQQVIQEKLKQLLGEEIEITGSGRTDTGVHALQQYFHADITAGINCEDFMYHLNAVLPKDILIRSVRPVIPNAHARFDATSRGYTYEIIKIKNPFKIDEAYIYPKDVDLEVLNRAAQLLVGKHDFESFSKVKTQVNHFNCEVFKAYWQQESQRTCFCIEANRFLRGMVRAMVGTLLLINENKLKVDELLDILKQKNRSVAGRAVPAEGLYLTNIIYPDSIFEL
jgi:tRNA pseudouridine38-40 synthase